MSRLAALLTLITLPLFVLGTRPAHSAPRAVAWPTFTLVEVTDGLSRPLHVTAAHDGSNRLFVVEQGGRIRIVQHGDILEPPFLDISDRVSPRDNCSECGLLSVAFPPDYATSGVFFVNYTANRDLVPGETGDANGDRDTVISRFRVSADPNRADPASEAVILVQNQPARNHNGGMLAFGPDDGLLYIGMGDGGGSGDPFANGQDPASMLGKLLRIQVGASGTYTVPADNPFMGNPAYRPEIWATGLRNPWKFSFDPATGDLYIADVGQDAQEEVNHQPAGVGGQNYGWPILEGDTCSGAATCDNTGLTLPVATYGRDVGRSITGGVLLNSRQPGQPPVYLYGDFISGVILGLQRDGAAWATHSFMTNDLGIAGFGTGENSAVYLVDLFGGALYQVFEPIHHLYLPTLPRP